MYSVGLTSIRLYAKSTNPSRISPSQSLLVVPPLVLAHLLLVVVGKDLLEKGSGRLPLSQQSRQKKVLIRKIMSSPHLNLKCTKCTFVLYLFLCNYRKLDLNSFHLLLFFGGIFFASESVFCCIYFVSNVVVRVVPSKKIIS